MESRDRYLTEITNNSMKAIKDKLVVPNITKHFNFYQSVHNVLKKNWFRSPNSNIYHFIGDDIEEKEKNPIFRFLDWDCLLK